MLAPSATAIKTPFCWASVSLASRIAANTVADRHCRLRTSAFWKRAPRAFMALAEGRSEDYTIVPIRRYSSSLKSHRAAVDTFGEKEKRKDILWLLDKLDRSLSHNRNEAVHAPLDFFTGLFESNISQTRIAPDTHSGSPLASRLSEKGDLLQEFKYYRDYAAYLSDCVLALFTCLRARDHGQPNWPRPDRPRLPNRNPPKARKASSRRQKKS